MFINSGNSYESKLLTDAINEQKGNGYGYSREKSQEKQKKQKT